MGLLTPSRGVWGLGVLWGLGVQTHPGTTARPCIGDRGHPKGLSPRGNVPQGCTHQQYGVHAEGGGGAWGALVAWHWAQHPAGWAPALICPATGDTRAPSAGARGCALHPGPAKRKQGPQSSPARQKK